MLVVQGGAVYEIRSLLIVHGEEIMHAHYHGSNDDSNLIVLYDKVIDRSIISDWSCADHSNVGCIGQQSLLQQLEVCLVVIG